MSSRYALRARGPLAPRVTTLTTCVLTATSGTVRVCTNADLPSVAVCAKRASSDTL